MEGKTMEPASGKYSGQDGGGIRIVVGCMSALYVFICLCFGVYVYIFRQQIPVVQNYFPTITPTPTATPVTHKPTNGEKIFKDDFSNNQNGWYGEDLPLTLLEINNGKLRLKSLNTGASGYAYCQSCPILTSPYYIQADLSTDRPTKETYGIGFSSVDFHSVFYLFEITTEPPAYNLYKYKNQTWTRRISRETDLIKLYPSVNTLGISLDHDLITLYINGEIVDTYEDTGSVMGSGKFWPYVDDVGFTLILDNLYTYGK
jgi:hypothetical protein